MRYILPKRRLSANGVRTLDRTRRSDYLYRQVGGNLVSCCVLYCLRVQITSGSPICGGEVSMCDTPPTLIIVHVDLVQHFIEGTDVDTADN
jgi:hypothetical protein